MFTAADHAYMAQALRLAEQGLYSTMPNPRVGCVIVKDGAVVGEGAHLRAGEPHAEVHALRLAGEQARGATVYVTLEPCGHHGRTPPCAEALVRAGVGRVIAAMQDPNPLVAGRGLALLAAQGIDASAGLMQAQARELNPGFVMRMAQQRPFVRSKIAASLDGRTALANGTNRVGVLAQNFGGLVGFHRHGVVDWRWSLAAMSPRALPRRQRRSAGRRQTALQCPPVCVRC